MRRFIHLALGAFSGALLAVLLSYLVTFGPALPYIAFNGALLGVVGGWLWGTEFVVPITATSLGAVVAGMIVDGLMLADAHAQHFDIDESESAGLLLIYGAVIGAVLGLGGGVKLARRLAHDR